MKTKMKKLSETRVEIAVNLDAAEMQNAHNLAVKNLAKTVKVQGFRPGKAPVELAEKNINPTALIDEELNIAIQLALDPAFKEAKVQALEMPKIDVKKFVPTEMMEFTLTADVLPEITLGDYKKLKAKKELKKVEDKDVEDVVKDVLATHAEKRKVDDRAAKKGDIVLIDFTGKENGVAFDGGSAKKYELEIGSKSFIDGFEEGIIGHKTGDEFVLNLSFPKNYHSADHAGKKVDFEVKLLEILEKIVPEMNDEFAKKIGFKTMDEFRADVKKNLESRYEYSANEKFKDDLVADLVEKSKVAAPEILIKDQVNLIKADVERNVGMGLSEYLKLTGETEEAWEKEAKKAAEVRVKASLVLQKVALAEKIDVEEKLVAAKIAELASVYGKSKEALASLKDPRVRIDIKNRMVIEKTLDFLVKVNQK